MATDDETTADSANEDLGAEDTTATEDEAEHDDAGHADAPQGEPTYEQLLADREHWREMAEAAGAGKAAQQAAGYRVKLRDTEHERDAALGLVDRLRDRAVRGELDRAGLDHRLLALAGVTDDQYLTEDGLVDADRLVAAVRPLAADLGVARPRRPQPNPLAGRTDSAAPPPTGKQVWDSAFGVGQR